MFRLTTDISFDLPTYDPFKSDTKSEHKSYIWHKFYNRTVNYNFFKMHLLGVLMCPYKSPANTEPYHWPFMP